MQTKRNRFSIIFLGVTLAITFSTSIFASTITQKVNKLSEKLKDSEKALETVTKAISKTKELSRKVNKYVGSKKNSGQISLLGQVAPSSKEKENIGMIKEDLITHDEILLKVDRALNPESFTSYKKIINIDTRGVKKEFVMFVGKSGSDKVLGTFLSPKSELGRSTLRIGDNMWLYIPNVKKPIRITSLQSVIGGLFNNSDIMGLDYSTEYNCISIDKSNGKLAMVLKAKTKSVAYETLKILANAESFHPVKIDCLTASGMLVKSLHFKKMTTFKSGIRRPAVIETDSPLFKGAKSILIYNKLKPQKLSDELFSINSMSKYKDLRK